MKRDERARLLGACTSPAMLHQWVKSFVGLWVPRVGVCAGHDAPFEYLRRGYFEQPRDMVVWAPRGGGKTRLGAVATLLDLLHRPGCEVRILGGSLEQALRMWEHLLPDVERLAAGGLAGKAKARGVRLKNGSGAGVVTQSQRAVRGMRVQKLRCDEVDMFDPAVWEAAKMVVKSRVQGSGFGVQGKEGGGSLLNPEPRPLNPIVGSVEAISTMHRPGGLMQEVVDRAGENGVGVVRWCVMEVLERCAAERACEGCDLRAECNGAAKRVCEGFYGIDDAIAMKRRVSVEAWEAEMLCRRPSARLSVFGHFDEAVHVKEERVRGSGSGVQEELWLGVDFGFAAPFVCLWIASAGDGSSYVIDEYVRAGRTIQEHLAEIEARPWGRAPRVACDPAGAGPNEQTAMSNVQVLRQRGYGVRYRKSLIVEGIEMIRAALRPAAGEPTLFVHPRCKRLIAALKAYRYADAPDERPIKDGTHDHPIDALRYYYVNRRRGELVVRRY